MSFNRPQFLEPVLASLRAQRFVDLDAFEAHLFQDGAVNRYSHIRYARDEDIDACVALFRRYFPNGVVHHARDNVGVCENFLRAETYLFEERGFDCAWFFEDDLALSPAYFAMMESLEAFALARADVGYFAAYGDYYLPKGELFDRRRELITLDHHWAFGLTQRHWRAMQPLLKPFYDIVVGEDYSRRDHRAVLALYVDQDIAPHASSQDAAKAIASDRLGVWRCNTVAPFGRYIGRTGQHMTEAQFDQMGFAKTVSMVDPVTLHFPDAAETRRRIVAQHEAFREIRRAHYDAFVQSLPVRKFNPMRPLSAQERAWIDECLPAPPPAERAALTALQSNAFKYVSRIVALSKDAAAWGALGRNCAKEDVDMIYRLFLHRQVDAEKVYEAHVGRHDVRKVAAVTLTSPDCQSLWGNIRSNSSL